MGEDIKTRSDAPPGTDAPRPDDSVSTGPATPAGASGPAGAPAAPGPTTAPGSSGAAGSPGATPTNDRERSVDTDEFSAAARPHPAARGTGETSFGDAEAPPAGPPPQRPATAPDKAAEYLELARRTQADFDNYRKRMARENAAAAERGAGRLAKELLPALDHLEIALKAAEAHTAPAAAGEGEGDHAGAPAKGGHEDVIRGFVMVRDELINALGKVGIEPFSPRGEAFDPSEHEAMAQRPADDADSGTVVEVYQQGYRINGTVLRPARVVVAQ